MYVWVYACACVCVCMYLYIDMDILRYMHEYVFVFMFVIVFSVTFCVHTISFDWNLVCFCPACTLLPQERRRRLCDLPICMDGHMVFRASSVGMHFIIFFSSFLCILVNLA